MDYQLEDDSDTRPLRAVRGNMMATADNTPQQAGAIPDDIRAIIDEYVRQEVARLTAGSNPEPAKVLTPEEQIAALLQGAYAAERSDHAIPSSSGRTHDIMLAILGMLIERVYPPVAAGE